MDVCFCKVGSCSRHSLKEKRDKHLGMRFGSRRESQMIICFDIWRRATRMKKSLKKQISNLIFFKNGVLYNRCRLQPYDVLMA